MHRRFYDLVYWMFVFILAILYRMRVRGRAHIPRDGTKLYVCNHQSLLDIPVVGVCVPGYPDYVARVTLLRNPVARLILRWLGAIPINRSAGKEGLQKTLALLEAGVSVVLFPEGTRTHDGELREFEAGVTLLLKKAADAGTVLIVPMAIDGSYDAWPRHRLLPGFARITVSIGKPIDAARFTGKRRDEVVAILHAAVAEEFRTARSMRH